MRSHIRMKVGIVRFPGSNCDFDVLKFFRRYGHTADFIWHKSTKILNWDLLVLPGGFAFGDREYEKATGKFFTNPGAQALRSPVMKIVQRYAERGRPILGICNGFQILIHAKLLPGSLLQNTSREFYCDFVQCSVEGQSFFRNRMMLGESYEIPVAHGYGRYHIGLEEYKELEANGQIFLKYSKHNPNGSYENVAGVSNREGTIFGMMPHPERMSDSTHFIKAIEQYVTN